ncbi:MAG TPA: sugar transferase [Acidimicrobiales bacterium]|nr:sugar transferase [Acidimicrobiales bacterium]
MGVVVGDAISVLLAGVIAERLRFGASPPRLLSPSLHLSLYTLSAVLAPVWVLVLASSRVYDRRVIGDGADEYRRILNAIVRLVALVAAAAFLLHLSLLSRYYVLVVGPLAVAFTIAAHWLARQRLHRLREAGRFTQRTVVVGRPHHVADLVRHLKRERYVGLEVVGACIGEDATGVPVDDAVVPVVASPADLIGWVLAGNADAVVLADAAVLGLGAIREFSWQLEGSGVDLIVAPSVTGVAGPRIAVRPVAGLPLLHVEEPRLDGVSRVIKGVVERVLAQVLLIVLAPLMVLIAAAVRATSRGPAFYRQVRVGRAGTAFWMYKFRTMVDGADSRQGDLVGFNESDGPLFKMRRDPRVTPVGRWLRRFSFDELPQIAHVVTGKMSMVGPRPPLPSELEEYTDEAWRRLLVRPGLTGLWQVSGRCDLPWMETLRLDLYYVENWSLALDFVIALKTFLAVVRGRGAY